MDFIGVGLVLSSIDLQRIESFQRSGKLECFDDLVRDHVGRVRSFIFPMVGDHALADDLTQETFLKAVKSIAQYQGESKFSTWLCSIAMNTCRDHFRKSKQGSKTTSLHAIPPGAESDGGAHSPLRSAERAEISAEVQAAMLKLSVDLRAAVTLVYIHGLSTAEAAALEKCSLTTMYWRIHQSKKQLGKLLGKYL